MSEQTSQLKRVSDSIANTVLRYCKLHRSFNANDLRMYVSGYHYTAPSSADRVLRDLRKRGLVDYEVLSRSKSLYKVTAVAA